MGMMAKMRSLAPWFIITVGGLFVLFMVISDSQVTTILGQRSNNIGYVNGDPITYQEFSEFLEQVRQQQQAQTGQDINETQMEVLREQVWDAAVSQKLIEEKIDEFGIIVTDEEVRDIILGPNPPEFLRQSFIDSNGVFNRELYQQALFDPQNREALIQAEAAIRQQQVQQKLRNYLEAAIVVSEGDIKREFIRKNTKVSADYAAVQVSRIPDTAVTVTDNDIETYYNQNKSEFKIEPKRKIKYVLFEKKAVEDDTVAVRRNLEAIAEELRNDTVSFMSYVNIYSDEPYSVDTVAINELSQTAVTALNEAESGEIVGPVLTNQGYVLYNLINKFRGAEEFVRASHILVRGTDETAKAKADSLYSVLQGGADFARIAREVSEDPGSAARGGDLGWFGRGQMVSEFENASFNGRVDVIQPPVQSQYGYHIIKVTGKSNNQFVVEKIVNKIEPSPTTLDRLYENASDFAYLANENGFESEAELLNYDIIESQPFAEDAAFVPGLGSAKNVVRFAFENSVGSISEVFRVPSGYVVCEISESVKGGFQPLEEVKNRVRSSVLKEKKLAKAMEIASEVKNQIGDNGNLSEAAGISPYVKVDKVNNYSVSNRNIPGVGTEAAFTEYCLIGEPGKISKPVEGNNGAYLIKVTERTPFDEEAYAKERNIIRDNLLQQRRSQYFQQWLAELKEEADIEDNRHLFYR